MIIDTSRVPWSCRGARFAFSSSDGRLVLKEVGGGDEISPDVFDLELLVSGRAVPATVEASPTRCAIHVSCDPSRRILLSFLAEDALAIRCEGAGLRFSMRAGRYDHGVALGANRFELQSYAKDRKFGFSGPEARLALSEGKDHSGARRIIVELSEGEARLEEYPVRPRTEAGAATAEASADSWETWQALLPAACPRLAAARDLAGYITWSCIVRPEGRLQRPAMYMSKNWMTNTWSWDNCFNALALARREPELALDQLLLFADAQHESGAYPDYVNDKFSSFSCLKPPIHAWALSRILERNEKLRGHAQLPRLYDSISASTGFWLENMTLPTGALAYRQGNDSGWDNASIFTRGGPVESPDLYAHLVRQCGELAKLAVLIGRPGESKSWLEKADTLVGSMIERLHDEDGFFARRGPEGERMEERGSLILRLPILISGYLPASIVAALMDELSDEKRFLAPFGPATEALDSPRFRCDGYWLGPVWAPASYLLIDALRAFATDGNAADSLRDKAATLAREIARRFVEAALKGGMAENFDPLSGEGLVDPAFTWTSSVFLLLLEDYPELFGKGL